MHATNDTRRPWQDDSNARRATHLAALVGAACSALLLLGCSSSSHDAAAGDTATAQATSTPRASSGPADTASRSDRATVRGTIAAVTDTAVTVTTRDGDVHVTLSPPVTIYTRGPAKLSDVQANTFVGVTSVPDPDGSQHATEIHIFPEALRGTGEGSYPMRQPGSAAASHSTMTNGSVTGAGGSARMTNGAAQVQPGGTITVQYNGGQQTIKVPAGVTVTAITATNQKLAVGTNVVVIAAKEPTGGLRSSAIFLVPDSTGRH